MKHETKAKLVRTLEIHNVEGDPFFELVQKINKLIAPRAYELYESRGRVHGNEGEDWLRAASQILLDVPVDIAEAETELTIRAEIPGFDEKDLEVRFTSTSVCIYGERQGASEQKEGKPPSSERPCDHIFRVLNLPSQVSLNGVNTTVSDGILKIQLSTVMGKVLEVLRKNKSATFIELSALSGIGQEDLEKVIRTLESEKRVKVTNRGNPLSEIVTLREMAFAASKS